MNISVLAISCLLLFSAILLIINAIAIYKINRKQVVNDLYSARLEFLVDRTLLITKAICLINRNLIYHMHRIKWNLDLITKNSNKDFYYKWIDVNAFIIELIEMHLAEVVNGSIYIPSSCENYINKLVKSFKLEKEEWIKYANGTMYEECKKQALKLNSKNNWFGRKY